MYLFFLSLKIWFEAVGHVKGSGSHGSRSRGGTSSSSRSYMLVDEAVDMPLDEHAPIPPLGDDVNPVVWLEGDGDAIEMPASVQQPRGPNKPLAPRTDIQSGDVFHLVMGR